MKKIVLIFAILSFQLGFAQKIGYIEMDRILEKIPKFQQVNAEIDSAVDQWQSETDAIYQQVEDLYQQYVQNQSKMSDDMKKKKQDEIFNKENEAKEFREEKFGSEGELYQMQEDLIKPITDGVYKTAENVAKTNGYDYLFEKTQESSWIYTNPDHDLTELVIKELGLE
ncbi:MAG: OmpH family outer membrane protein [Bacteroidales bacterium]|nr:OmpH family outer membrane protein [Bacteroidales bacterium]